MAKGAANYAARTLSPEASCGEVQGFPRLKLEEQREVGSREIGTLTLEKRKKVDEW